MNIQELPVKEDKNQKNESYFAYQPCEVTVLSADPSPNVGKFQTYQSITILGQHGVAIQGSWVYPNSNPQGAFKPDNIGKPIACEVQVKTDATQYAVNGLKYTIREPKPQGEGGGFRKGGGGGWKPSETPGDKAAKSASMGLAYAKDLVVSKDIPVTDILAKAGVFADFIEDYRKQGDAASESEGPIPF